MIYLPILFLWKAWGLEHEQLRIRIHVWGGQVRQIISLSLPLSLSQLQQRRDLCTLFFFLFCSFLFRMWEGGRGTCWLINFLFPLPLSPRPKTRRPRYKQMRREKNSCIFYYREKDLQCLEKQIMTLLSSKSSLTGTFRIFLLESIIFVSLLPSFVLQCCLSLAM